MAVFGDLMRSVAKTFDKIRGQNQTGAALEQAKTSTEQNTPAETDGPTPAETRSEDVKKPQTKVEPHSPHPVENKQTEAKTEHASKSNTPANASQPEAKETSAKNDKT